VAAQPDELALHAPVELSQISFPWQEPQLPPQASGPHCLPEHCRAQDWLPQCQSPVHPLAGQAVSSHSRTTSPSSQAQ
jgi:hypothetical protein